MTVCKYCNGTGEEPDQAAISTERRAARVGGGVSLRDVAGRMGFSAAYISDLELGRRKWNAFLLDQHQRAIVALGGKR